MPSQKEPGAVIRLELSVPRPLVIAARGIKSGTQQR
jgi:hypothetical protein